MNHVDHFLARIRTNGVVIKTTLDSYSVIEKIEDGLRSNRKIRRRGSLYSYEGSYEGNYFKIQCHYHNQDGTDAFTADRAITINLPFYSFEIPYRFETSPVFYANVFDDEAGAVIRGHFGIPLPFIYLIIAIVLLLGARSLSGTIRAYLLVLAIGLIIGGLNKLREFFTEQDGILEFLHHQFKDDIR